MIATLCHFLLSGHTTMQKIFLPVVVISPLSELSQTLKAHRTQQSAHKFLHWTEEAMIFHAGFCDWFVGRLCARIWHRLCISASEYLVSVTVVIASEIAIKAFHL